MSKKGGLTFIGAVAGFFATYFLISVLDEQWYEINSLTLIFLFPGAIIGAIIGFAVGGRDNSSKKEEKLNGQDVQPQNKTAISELLDYKKLLDSGIITQEEFDKKKEELLKKL